MATKLCSYFFNRFTIKECFRLATFQRVVLKNSKLKFHFSAMANLKQVTFSSANTLLGDCNGILFGNNVTKKGLIVIHEWWGANDQINDEALQIANEGNFMTLVPDFYRGKVAIDAEQAGHLMGNLNWDGALQDINGAAEYLKTLGCNKVGVVGFCMGGALSFAAATKCQQVSAAAPFYGIPDSKIFDLTKIKIPVQAHFGKKDDIVGFSSAADYLPLKEKLLGAGVKLELFEYNCGHAFTNKTGPLNNYNDEECKLAFKRMYDFFNKNLS